MSTIPNAVIGNVIGTLRWVENLYFPNKTHKDVVNASKYFNNDITYQAQRYVCSSIREKKEINISDIKSKLYNLDMSKFDPDDGSVLCWIFPFGFYSSYEHDGISMHHAIRSVVTMTHSDEASDTCIEYARLLHDIFWNYIEPESILKLFPQLIITKEQIGASRTDIKSILTAALWAFGHSTDFNNALANASALNPSKPWVSCVTGTLAGLYYGTKEISDLYITQTGVQPFIDDLMLS